MFERIVIMKSIFEVVRIIVLIEGGTRAHLVHPSRLLTVPFCTV